MKKNLLMASVLCVSAYAVQDGTLDPLFGTDGQVIAPINNLANGSNAVFKADGSLLIPFANAGLTHSAVMHFNADGTFDPDFIIDYQNMFLPIIALQPDNKIVMGGISTAKICLVRYNADGSLDTSFGNNGQVILPFDFEVFSVAIQKDGKIVAAGKYNSTAAIARFTASGQLDTSFNSTGQGSGMAGIVFVSPLAIAVDINYVQIDREGRIVICSATSLTNPHYFFLARYLSDGTLDRSFGTNQGYTITSINGTDIAQALAIQNDDKIVVGGVSAGHLAFARYSSAGLLDASFATQGIFQTGVAGNCDSMQLQTDGKIVSNILVNNGFNVLRLTTAGALDDSFGTNGIVTHTILGTTGVSYACIVNATGKIAVRGRLNNATVGIMQLSVDSLKYSPLSQAIWKRYYNQNI